MTKIFASILIITIFSTCKKKEEQQDCTNDNCYGKHNYTITNNDKSYITIKDTIYKFASIYNDTIILKFRATNTEILTSKFSCACEDKSTDISTESIYSIYQFDNKDLALKYSICATYPENYEAAQTNSGNVQLEVLVSDTNTVIHKIYKSTGPCSQFKSFKYNLKHNDLDSLNVNSKYFYNIINTFDYAGLCNTSEIKDIYYSKSIGLVRFKYNNIVYDIVH